MRTDTLTLYYQKLDIHDLTNTFLHTNNCAHFGKE